jgi:hypothetical protein
VAARGQSRKQAQQQASTQKSAKQQDYLKARGVCLEGKGYSVKQDEASRIGRDQPCPGEMKESTCA